MIEPLTILTWLWVQPGGRAEYTAEHVNIWADMVRRHLTLPHTFACVTDQPSGISSYIEIIEPPREFECIEVPTWRASVGKPQCMRRVSMFRPDAAEIFGRRFVCMDLDCIISANIDGLLSRTEDIVLYASPLGAPDNRPYNGSMLLMTAGSRPQVYERLTPQGAFIAGQKYIGSDQAWISYALGPGEATWSEKDGVLWWGRWREGIEGRIVFFPGHPKPWQIVGRYEWAARNYHRNRGGRCLVVGCGDDLWSEVEREIQSGPFDAVIALPEPAQYWPTELTAVVETEEEAVTLAASFGFDDIRYCGKVLA